MSFSREYVSVKILTRRFFSVKFLRKGEKKLRFLLKYLPRHYFVSHHCYIMKSSVGEFLTGKNRSRRIFSSWNSLPSVLKSAIQLYRALFAWRPTILRVIFTGTKITHGDSSVIFSLTSIKVCHIVVFTLSRLHQTLFPTSLLTDRLGRIFTAKNRPQRIYYVKFKPRAHRFQFTQFC